MLLSILFTCYCFNDWLIKGILTDIKLRALSKFPKIEFFAYYASSPLRTTLPQKNWTEIISVANKSSFNRILVHENLFNTIVLTWKRDSVLPDILEKKLFLFISFDSCHKTMLLESVNIPVIDWFVQYTFVTFSYSIMKSQLMIVFRNRTLNLLWYH